MTPEIYFKILLLVLGREALVTSFSLADFFANGDKPITIINLENSTSTNSTNSTDSP